MNEFDQFVKHTLKVKKYVRYTDDFIIISRDRKYLEQLLPPIRNFLQERLRLSLHPNKVTIRKYAQGIDFLGYVVLPKYIVVRTKTQRRIFRKLKERVREYQSGAISKVLLDGSVRSYGGVFSHADAFELNEKFKNQYWFWLNE